MRREGERVAEEWTPSEDAVIGRILELFGQNWILASLILNWTCSSRGRRRSARQCLARHTQTSVLGQTGTEQEQEQQSEGIDKLSNLSFCTSDANGHVTMCSDAKTTLSQHRGTFSFPPSLSLFLLFTSPTSTLRSGAAADDCRRGAETDDDRTVQADAGGNGGKDAS